ncbi:beta transducin [Didymosphaeria variabile]|uniref:Beta transducin n=1 Tax=Didymosphaeria variabile TaxID=1932322 RepID=A0A9W9C5P5_9PLEO|nr:beta transducin [Didymosphaeria variabile]KAJ4345259.1 beta transducin [Didymosphaeria variabile]
MSVKATPFVASVLGSIPQGPDTCDKPKTSEPAVSEPPTSQPELEPSTETDGKSWEVVKLTNGLISMENTPPWLVDVVKRNALQSPLLRLPVEIRTMIWQYVKAGSFVNVRLSWMTSTCTKFGVALVGPCTYLQDPPQLPAAIRLREVCRQLYFELSQTAYSGTIFLFNTVHAQDVRTWAEQLTPAHKNADTDIASYSAWLIYPVTLPGQPICESLPGLQRVHMYRSGKFGYQYVKEGSSWKLLEDSGTRHDRLML